MDNYSAGKSPRRELQLQGPRPTPLRIHKDSHKIKKPPIVPQPAAAASQPHSQQHLYQQPRQPVIIYTVSPKVIHTNPSEFMDLVQRLTGLPPSNSSSSSSPTANTSNIPSPYDPRNNTNYNNNPPTPHHRHDVHHQVMNKSDVGEGMEMDGGGDDGVRQLKGLFPGILSPGPGSLAPIPSNFFSPPSDSFFHDLSPVLHGNRNFIEGSFMPSPSNFFSPVTPSIDLFNNFPDL